MAHSNHDELLAYLKTTALFQSLSDSEFLRLKEFIRIVDHRRGEWLLQEGEEGEHVYILLKGRAELLKKDEATGENQLIGLLRPGDLAGEMAHLEKKGRSASVRAIEEIESALLLLDRIAQSPEHQEIYQKLIQALSQQISLRLSLTDDQLISALKEKYILVQSTTQIGKTIIYTAILFAVYFNLVTAYTDYAGSFRNLFNLIFMPTATFLFGVGALRLIEKSGYSYKFYGLTMEHAGKVAFQSIVFTIPLLAFLALLKWALITQIPAFSKVPFFSLIRPDQSFAKLLEISAYYVLLIPVQELIVRGVLQSSFRNFFQGSNRVFYAILTSNLLFEVLHTGSELFLAIFSFTFGIFWGALFEHQKSLVGVAISHILIGWWGIVALDLLSLVPKQVGI